MLNVDPFNATLHQWNDMSLRRSMHKFFHYARENGLSMSQIGALLHLRRRHSSAVTDLGDHLGVTSAAASQMLDRLVQQELILRVEDPHDRRAKQIFLTPKGRQLIEDGLRARQDWLDELAATLTADEKDQVAAALKILIARMDRLGRPTEPEKLSSDSGASPLC
jgi:DNA-binding MarR family transcriptional regulator